MGNEDFIFSVLVYIFILTFHDNHNCEHQQKALIQQQYRAVAQSRYQYADVVVTTPNIGHMSKIYEIIPNLYGMCQNNAVCRVK